MCTVPMKSRVEHMCRVHVRVHESVCTVVHRAVCNVHIECETLGGTIRNRIPHLGGSIQNRIPNLGGIIRNLMIYLD